jgi:hypothetical protein
MKPVGYFGHLDRSDALSETDRVGGSQIRFDGVNDMAKMTEQQRLEYKLYRKECRFCNVEPVLADFLAGNINSGVAYWMELAQNELEWEQRKALAAAA